MIVIGIGFRAAASANSLQDAIAIAMASQEGTRIDALVTEAAKSREAVFQATAQTFKVPGLGITQTDLAQMITPTQSARIQDRFGTGSLAEAAALAAAGPSAQLIVKRVVSSDGLATAAIANSQRKDTT